MRVLGQGFGAGDKDFPVQANVLRVLVGESTQAPKRPRYSVIEANIDDTTPQVLGYAMERLLAAGALDVTLTPMFMKKNRAATQFSVIAAPDSAEELIRILFAETTTLGRSDAHQAERRVLAREIATVDTQYGAVRIKHSERGDFTPEFDDCKRAAETHSVPLRTVIAEANLAYPKTTMSKGKYYLTTPIYYVNAAPHIGHAYTTIAAETIARFKRMQGYEVLLTSGTDEHGTKVERAARAQGKAPEDYVSVISNEFRCGLEEARYSHRPFRADDGTRITAQLVNELFEACKANGYIYKGTYTGLYAVVSESFVNDAKPGDIDPETGKPYEEVTEENYFFKLSAFTDRLLEFYDANPDFIGPEIRRNEVLAFVRQGLSDLSITRTSIKWGIPVESDPAHVFYVWFDALTTYMSAVRADNAWPADLHLIG